MSASRREISFTVNGALRTVSVYPMERLLDVLRNNWALREPRRAAAKESAAPARCC